MQDSMQGSVLFADAREQKAASLLQSLADVRPSFARVLDKDLALSENGTGKSFASKSKAAMPVGS